jgi:hypothetical protein
MFENRRWLVIPTNITGSINFNEVAETSSEYLRVSLDGTKTFIKYDINEVTSSYTEVFVNVETNESGSYTVEAGIYGRPSIYSSEYPEYTHEEILNLLTGSEWVSNTIE